MKNHLGEFYVQSKPCQKKIIFNLLFYLVGTIINHGVRRPFRTFCVTPCQIFHLSIEYIYIGNFYASKILALQKFFLSTDDISTELLHESQCAKLESDPCSGPETSAL